MRGLGQRAVGTGGQRGGLRPRLLRSEGRWELLQGRKAAAGGPAQSLPFATGTKPSRRARDRAGCDGDMREAVPGAAGALPGNPDSSIITETVATG